jgi:hypothetical protein
MTGVIISLNSPAEFSDSATIFRQRVVVARPPMWAEIDAAFGVSRKRGILFAWGDRIYNPDGVQIPAQLFAHEAVHGVRQEKYGVETWWRDYIGSRPFRFDEELPAHRAEYRYLSEQGNRTHRRAALAGVAAKLAAPLYGNLVTLAEAKRALRGDA